MPEDLGRQKRSTVFDKRAIIRDQRRNGFGGVHQGEGEGLFGFKHQHQRGQSLPTDFRLFGHQGDDRVGGLAVALAKELGECFHSNRLVQQLADLQKKGKFIYRIIVSGCFLLWCFHFFSVSELAFGYIWMLQCALVQWLAQTTLPPSLCMVVMRFCQPPQPIVTIRAFGSGAIIRTTVIEPNQRIASFYFDHLWEFVYLAQDGTRLPALTLLIHHPTIWVMQKEWTWPLSLEVKTTMANEILTACVQGTRTHFGITIESRVPWLLEWKLNGRKIGLISKFSEVSRVEFLGWSGEVKWCYNGRCASVFDVLDALVKAIAEAPARTTVYGDNLHITVVNRVATKSDHPDGLG